MTRAERVPGGILGWLLTLRIAISLSSSRFEYIEGGLKETGIGYSAILMYFV